MERGYGGKEGVGVGRSRGVRSGETQEVNSRWT